MKNKTQGYINMRLKTQKEIYDTEPFKNATEFKNKERQGAIKWIKELKEFADFEIPLENQNQTLREIIDDRGCCSYSIIAFIEYIFNITEEDLK